MAKINWILRKWFKVLRVYASEKKIRKKEMKK